MPTPLYLVAMNENEMIEYDGQDIQTPVTKKINKDTSQTAIVGSIPCGSSLLQVLVSID